MSGRGIKIAIAITKEIIPLIINLLEEIDKAKAENSEGGRKVTKAERQKIALDMSLSIVPKLHDIITDIINKEV